MPRRKSDGMIAGQFVAHRIEMLESDAWRTLSIVARRILDRLEIEHGHHGGKENGNLPCTYDDVAAYGVRRQSIADGIEELATKGLVVKTEQGRGGNAVWRKPSTYRLTYLPTNDRAATDDWKRYRAPKPIARGTAAKPEPEGIPPEI